MLKFKVSEKSIEELEPEELVDDYCSTDFVKKACEGRIKELRENTIQVIEREGVKKDTKTGKSLIFQTENSNLILEKRDNFIIDFKKLEKITSEKNILIGKIKQVIKKKNEDEIIPKKFLEGLDKYFEITEELEVTSKDIKEAFESDLITEKEKDIIMSNDPINALKPSLSEKGQKKIKIK